MGRPERELNPDDGPVQRFAHLLRRLRDDAGRPGYRTMAKTAHYSVTALAEAAGGDRLPTLPVALAYARACGGDQDTWERHWREAEAELAQGEDTITPPYLGLATFQPDDADRYLGRDSLVAHLVHQVARTSVVAVVGASGSGKSSLIRAGLLPAIDNHPVFSGHPWSTVLLTPTAEPLRELARAVARLHGDEPDRSEPGWLDRALRHADPTGGGRVLLVVDQFEELFTLCHDPGERTAFIDALLDAARGGGRIAHVILGVRADFYGHCATHPGLLGVLGEGTQVLVGPMTRDELRSAITEPATRAGMTVERDLVATMLADIAGEPGGLPLLSHALLETWRRRRGGALTQAGYHACGGVHGALAQTAERVYAEFDPAEQKIAHQMFLRLTALGDGTEDTRRRAGRAELATVGAPDTVTRVLDQLAAARLVVVDADSIEVAHEALIRAWPRLHRWLTDDRDGVVLHRRITDATQVWRSSDRDPGLLYRATQLDQVAPWADRPDLNADEREFLDASIRLRDKQNLARRRRTLRLRVATVAVVALLAIATVITLRQRDDARDHHRVAVARQLVAEATALREVDPLRAARLSLAAWRIAPDVPATRDSLISTQAYPLPTRLAGHSGDVRDVAYSPDGHVLATAAGDSTVRLWDTSSRQPIGEPLVGHTAMVTGLVFSPDGTKLATSSNDGTVRVWDLTRRAAIGEPLSGHKGTVTGIAFTPDGRFLVTGGADSTVRTWDAATGAAVGAPMTGHTGPITAVAVSLDGTAAATASNDKTVRLWDLATKTQLAAPLTGHTSLTNGVAFSPDGRLLASTSGDKTVRLWDVATRTQLGTPLTGHTNVTYGVAFSPDGRSLATSGWDKTVRLWDTATGRQLGTPLTGSTSSVFNLAFSPDGSALAGGDADGSALVWSLRGTPVPAHTDAVYAVALSPDGAVLGTAADDRAVRLWDTATHAPLAALTGHTAEVRAIAFSPRGGILATGSWDGTLRLWDAATHAPIGGPLTGHTGWVRGLAVSPDGRLVATAGMDMTVRLWDAATGAPVGGPLTGHTNSVTGIAFSPDGRILATGANDKTVRLWDVATRSPLGDPMTGHTSVVRDVVFSPDGAILASAGDDKAIHLWDVATRSETGTLAGHAGEVLKLAFSPDGSELASTSLDKTVRLWDLTGRSTTTVLTAGTGLAGIAYAPGGLVTGGVSGNVLWWTTNTEQVADSVCTALAGELSDEDWERLVPTWPKPRLCPA